MRARRRARRFLLAAIAGLYVASIPWYRTAAPEGSGTLVLGLPDWVAVALACYVGVAILNALAWGLAEVPDGPPEDADPEQTGREL